MVRYELVFTVFWCSFSDSFRSCRFSGGQCWFWLSRKKILKKLIFCRFFETSSDHYSRTTGSIFDPRHVLRSVFNALQFGTKFGAKFKILIWRHLIGWIFFSIFFEIFSFKNILKRLAIFKFHQNVMEHRNPSTWNTLLFS